jgi:hypothetical protein
MPEKWTDFLVFGVPLGIALLLRAPGLPFALPYLLEEHDERCVVESAVGIFGGDWLPTHFRYPTFFIWLSYICYIPFSWWLRVSEQIQSPEALLAWFDLHPSAFYLISRSLSLLAGLASVATVVSIGRRLCGNQGGLVAGLILALNPLHIELSRTARVDLCLVLWILVTLHLLVRYAMDPKARDLVLATVSLGLALSTKYSAAALLVPALVAAIARAPRERSIMSRRSVRLLLVVLVPLSIFALLNPHTVFHPDGLFGWFNALSQRVGRPDSGPISVKPASYVYYARLLVGRALGSGFLLAALVGVAVFLRKYRLISTLYLSFLIPYSIVFVFSRPASEHYLLPAIAVLSLLAGHGIVAGSARLRVAAPLVLCIAFIPTARDTLGRVLVGACQSDTRLAAARWIEQSLPSGQTLVLIDESLSAVPLTATNERPLASRFWLRNHLRAHQDLIERARVIAAGLPESTARPRYDLRPMSATDWLEQKRKLHPAAVVVVERQKRPAPAVVLDEGLIIAEFRPSWRRDGPTIQVWRPQ